MPPSPAFKETVSTDDDHRRILVVDDDADFADALAEMLLINDFVPRTANSADQALALMQDFEPAMALIDIRLGQESGLAQIPRLRAIDPSLLCVVVTAYADTEAAIDALRRGADDFLRKPLRAEDLLAVILRCLSKRRLANEKAAMESRLSSLQKSESIAQMSGGMAHEFNNLLTVVLGNAGFLRDNIAREEPGTATARLRWIDAIERSATRGAKLTRQLLAYARKEPLQPRSIDLSQAVASLHELLDASLGDGIRVNMVLPGELWPVTVDPRGLEEAMVNLALNARDAMPSGGIVTIAMSNRRLSEPLSAHGVALAPGDYVAITVDDTGEGMPEDVRARAFDPFFTTRDVGRGTGLGLSMVHGFAAQSGGAATIESRAGKGTRVTLHLPRAGDAVAPTVPGAATAPSPRHGASTVMVVEDDAEVRVLATSLLEEMGYRCLVAESGTRAISLLDQGEHVDLLFTDMTMPGGLDGHALRDEALKRRPGLPVVFASGHHENAALDDEAGRTPWLRKPYDKASLGRAVAEAMAKS